MLLYRLNRGFIWDGFILLLLLVFVLNTMPALGSLDFFTSAYNSSNPSHNSLQAAAHNASVNHVGHTDKASSIKPPSPMQKTAGPSEAEKQKVIESYGKLPISFVPNKGQINSKVKYYAQGAGYNFYLTKDEITYSFLRDKPGATKSQSAAVKPLQQTGQDQAVTSVRDQKEAVPQEAYALKLKFIGANPNTTLKGQSELGGKVNYLVGSDKDNWKTDISTYSQVVYNNLYPGIDLIYRGSQGRIKYEFVVAPGVDHKNISLLYQGALSLKLDKNKDLIIDTPWGSLKDERPHIYQVIDGKKRKVNGDFSLKGNNVGFSVASYNRGYPLIIDPGLIYSSFLGGSDNCDYGIDIAVDGSGNAYITGETGSSDFPTTTGAYDISFTGVRDAFVAKLNADGTGLIYSTFLGGNSDDRGYGIALDTSGNAYVTGETISSDFPTTPGAYDTTHNGNWDAFVTKLNADGTGLIYSTFLGGNSDDRGYGIALDTSGNAYVTGETISSDFPTAPGAYDTTHNGNWDAFVTKLNSDGTGLVYSTFLAGASWEQGNCIALDAAGNAYVAGYTDSADFPTTPGAYDTIRNGYHDAFVTKLNADGTALIYSTFLGGSSGDSGYGIALDTSGNAYVTGHTDSSDFPTTAGVHSTTHNGNTEAFVAKLNADGSALIYSTFLGRGGHDGGNGIALDTSGNAYVTGFTNSSDFPTAPGAYDTTHNGNWDAFVAKLNADGTALIYSTFLGGSNEDQGYDIALDTSGNVYVTGRTASSGFPVTTGAYDTSHNGGYDAFAIKLDLSTSTTPPTTILWTEPTSANPNGWFMSPTTIHLDRGNEAGSTYFKWNNETTQTYSVPFLAREGTNVLHYWSVDISGNMGEVGHQIFQVDTQPPAAFNLSSPTNGSTTSNALPTLSWGASSDAISGLAKYQLYIDGSLNRDNIPANSTSTTPTSALSSGSHTWYIKVVDDAGNTTSSPVMAVNKSSIVLTTNITTSDITHSDPYKLVDNIFYSGGASLWVRGSSGYLKFDLGQSTYIDNMNIVYNSNSPDIFELLVSADDVNYTSLGYVSLPSWSGQPNYDRSVKANAKYIKFVWGPVPSGYSGTMYEEITFYSPNSWNIGVSNDNNLPAAPSNLTASDVPNDQGGAINLTWLSSTSQDVTGYKIYRGTTAGSYDTTFTVGNVNAYVDNAVVTGTTYYYRVAALNGVGSESLPSNEVSVVSVNNNIDDPPTVPSNVRITSVTSTQIALAWDASTDDHGVAGYVIFDAANSTAINTVTATSFSHTGLLPDTPHNYFVKAFDTAGNLSEGSEIVSARTTYGAINTPTGSPNLTLSNDISIIFSNVTAPGETNATISNNPPAGSPSGFRFRGNYVDISTTATFAGSITITIPYDPALISGNVNNLKLFHWNGSNWEDVTVSVDTNAHTITGRTTSLSPFVVAESEGGGGGGIGYGMNTNILLALSLMLTMMGVLLVFRRSLITRE